jgi:hypothetical protein
MIYFLLLSLSLTACRKDSDGDENEAAEGPNLLGMYEVTYHTLSHTNSAADLVDCTTEGDAVTIPPYIHMTEDFISGYEMEECDYAGESTCTFTSWNFNTAQDDGWTWENPSTQIGGGYSTCTLYYTEASAIVQDDNILRIVIKDWYDSNDLSEDECTLEAARELGDETDCMHHEVIVATPVSDWTAPDNGWPLTEPPANLEEEGFAVGDVIPDFLLMDQHGDNVSIWQFYDLLVAVNVSTMWNFQSQELAGGVEETYQDFKDERFIYLTILSQNLEDETPSQENLNEWADFFGLTTPVVADKDGEYSEPLVGGEPYPILLLLNRDLTIREKIESPTDQELRLAIEEALD